MNLIEAWKKARPGQPISRAAGTVKLWKVEVGFRFSTETLGETSLLAEDWEVVKEKKVVVLEEVKWDNHDGIVYVRQCKDWVPWHELPSKPPMKMTLEWEE